MLSSSIVVIHGSIQPAAVVGRIIVGFERNRSRLSQDWACKLVVHVLGIFLAPRYTISQSGLKDGISLFSGQKVPRVVMCIH